MLLPGRTGVSIQVQVTTRAKTWQQERAGIRAADGVGRRVRRWQGAGLFSQRDAELWPTGQVGVGLPTHCSLLGPTGGLQAVAELLQVDYEMHKMTRDPLNLALRRYAGMTLTNLTFGDVANKVLRASGCRFWAPGTES